MSQQCQEVFTQRKTFSLKSHKINWSAVINFTCTNTVSISSTVKNISSTEKRVLQWSCDRKELLWWMENLKFFDGKKIQQREPPMIIQADVSTKGWGIQQGSFDRGAWSKKEKHFHIKMFKELSAELIIDIKIFNPNFQEEFVRPDHSCSSGQQSCCVCLQAVSPTSPIWHGSQIQTVLQQIQCSRIGNAVHDRHNLGIPSY